MHTYMYTHIYITFIIYMCIYNTETLSKVYFFMFYVNLMLNDMIHHFNDLCVSSKNISIRWGYRKINVTYNKRYQDLGMRYYLWLENSMVWVFSSNKDYVTCHATGWRESRHKRKIRGGRERGKRVVNSEDAPGRG